MGEWSIRPAGAFLLLFILVVIGLTQVLPQVDLPDTAFHEDTAPVVTKFRATSAPVAPVTTAPLALGLFHFVIEHSPQEQSEPAQTATNFVPILHCSLLC